MSSQTACAVIQRVQPFESEPPHGQAIAALVLLVGAVWAIAWAMGASPVLSDPPAMPRLVRPAVSSAQVETAAVRIRFAES